MTSTTSTSRITRLARAAKQARAISVPLLVAGALAAGCGTAQAPAPGSGSGKSTPTTSASAVPTVTGGPVAAGQPACDGWPTGATHGTLTAFFNPVAVERCVTGYQRSGKTEWQTATLEKATANLTPLVTALLKPSLQHKPGTVCPYLVILPPQVVLISADGKQLIPRLPVSGCGVVESGVLGALSTLTWKPVSVRLVAKVTGAQPATAAGVSPKTIQTQQISVPPNQPAKGS